MMYAQQTQPAYVPASVWLCTPPMFAPAPAPKPVKEVFNRPKRLPNICCCTTQDVANHLAEHGECSATEITMALKTATSTVCEMLIRLEQKGYVKRSRGRVPTRAASVWRWKLIKPYRQPQTQRSAIKEWLRANPWRTAHQIKQATGFGSLSNTLKAMVLKGDVDCEERANRHGKLLRHYALTGGAE